MIDETLKKRLVSSAFFITLTVATIFLSPEWLFFLVVQAFSLFALNEFLSLAEKKNIEIHRNLSLFFAALFPFAAFYSAEPLVLGSAAFAMFVANFKKEAREKALFSTSVSMFGLVYIPCLFSHLIKVRHFDYGSALIFYMILIAKGGDAGAYFIGKKYGKTKLIEHISPNKSVEGAIGGFVTTVLLSLLSKIYLPEIPLFHLLVLGVLVGVISQVGDLAESLVKRDVGVKDSGQVPGLGGILDVLDSILFTVPLVYYYVLFAL